MFSKRDNTCLQNYSLKHYFYGFTALHKMQTRSSNENSVCLSVCPSVKSVNCDKTEEKISPDFYIMRKNI